MPYIVQDKRNTLDPVIDDLHNTLVGLQLDDETNNMEGNLNYTITRLLRMCYGESYGEINDAIGMLQCVMLEHYRTVAAPYEAQAKHDNGDIELHFKKEVLKEVVVKSKPECGDGC